MPIAPVATPPRRRQHPRLRLHRPSTGLLVPMQVGPLIPTRYGAQA
ncbi:MAG: hypothetical protein R3B68_08275 [Phycisphaerales bacterium]